MAAPTLNITFDLGTLMDITAAVNKEVIPLLHQAVNAVGQQVASNWRNEVMQAKLWAGEKDAYIKSISWNMTGDFSGVVEATYKHAAEIETGRPARDLKKMLNTSKKVRRTEDGRRFLVIPMRHNKAKLEAAGLYGIAKALEASSVAGQSRRPSGQVTHLSPKTGMTPSDKQTPFLSNLKAKGHMMVPKNNYLWGARLTAQQAGEHKWAQGLYRFNTSAGNAKSSSFLSFRVMIEGSNGWVVPAQPGKYLAKKVVDEMTPKANAAFAEAVDRSIK